MYRQKTNKSEISCFYVHLLYGTHYFKLNLNQLMHNEINEKWLQESLTLFFSGTVKSANKGLVNLGAQIVFRTEVMRLLPTAADKLHIMLCPK